jgi:DnaJ-class molecular chaperone
MYDPYSYAILGISPTATTSQVKEAYHRLARQYHPDLNKDPLASERMKEINIDRYNHAVSPMHFPPTAIPKSTP